MEHFDLHIITNLFVMTMLLITATSIAVSRNLLTATILFSIFSLLMALIYIVLNAPDVAITEAAIGAGISSILFLGALLIVGEEEKYKKYNVWVLVIFTLTTVALAFAFVGLPEWGAANLPASTHLAPYFIEQSYNDIGIPNIVTSILASYRGFDTLGEVFVVFTAAIAIISLLQKPSDEVE